MVTRRDWLRLTAQAGAALGLTTHVSACQAEAEGTPAVGGGVAQAAQSQSVQNQPLLTRAIPSTGEQVPVIGLGGRWISSDADAEELAAHREVLHVLAEGAEGAGRVFDTAAGYGGGGSEEFSGLWAEEDGFGDDLFWATKVNVAGRGGGSADPQAVRDQIERSFARLRRQVIDLNQVHNMGDPPTQLGILQEYKESGRIRYIGITTTSDRQYDALADVMDEYPVDFVSIDYAIDNRTAEERILPLAADKGIAVMVYLPFGRRRMWERIGDLAVPEWAAEFDAHTWGQFMLKFVVANEAVTVAAPGTGNPEHMLDNLGAGRGGLPTEAHLQRMVELVEGLPGA
ncbi:MAG: aldo/keto reductase [Longimicrobiales bacterium]